MKVAVNIHCLHPPLTGIGHYARHLLELMLADSSVEVVGLSHRGWHSADEVAAIVTSDVGYVEAEAPPVAVSEARRFLRRIPGASQIKAQLTACRRRAVDKRHQDALYWEPNYLLLPNENPALVTVHDLSHLRHPEFHPDSRLQELARLPESIARAGALATVSEFSRRELSQLMHIDPEDVLLIPPAVSSDFAPREESELAELRARLRLPEHFILFAGTLEPRKNLPRLLRAFSSLPADIQREYPLLIAGSQGWHYDGLQSVIGELDNANIRCLGYVDNADMPGLFAAATVFAYPSLYEGFGMPVLEAMASGCAVLTSDCASLPEVAEDGALLVDPHSQASIQEGLLALLENAALRRDFIARGLSCASSRRWQSSYGTLRDALACLAV